MFRFLQQLGLPPAGQATAGQSSSKEPSQRNEGAPLEFVNLLKTMRQALHRTQEKTGQGPASAIEDTQVFEANQGPENLARALHQLKSSPGTSDNTEVVAPSDDSEPLSQDAVPSAEAQKAQPTVEAAETAPSGEVLVTDSSVQAQDSVHLAQSQSDAPSAPFTAPNSETSVLVEANAPVPTPAPHSRAHAPTTKAAPSVRLSPRTEGLAAQEAVRTDLNKGAGSIIPGSTHPAHRCDSPEPAPRVAKKAQSKPTSPAFTPRDPVESSILASMPSKGSTAQYALQPETRQSLDSTARVSDGSTLLSRAVEPQSPDITQPSTAKHKDAGLQARAVEPQARDIPQPSPAKHKDAGSQGHKLDAGLTIQAQPGIPDREIASNTEKAPRPLLVGPSATPSSSQSETQWSTLPHRVTDAVSRNLLVSPTTQHSLTRAAQTTKIDSISTAPLASAALAQDVNTLQSNQSPRVKRGNMDSMLMVHAPFPHRHARACAAMGGVENLQAQTRCEGAPSAPRESRPIFSTISTSATATATSSTLEHLAQKNFASKIDASTNYAQENSSPTPPTLTGSASPPPPTTETQTNTHQSTVQLQDAAPDFLSAQVTSHSPEALDETSATAPAAWHRASPLSSSSPSGSPVSYTSTTNSNVEHVVDTLKQAMQVKVTPHDLRWEDPNFGELHLRIERSGEELEISIRSAMNQTHETLRQNHLAIAEELKIEPQQLRFEASHQDAKSQSQAFNQERNQRKSETGSNSAGTRSGTSSPSSSSPEVTRRPVQLVDGHQLDLIA